MTSLCVRITVNSNPAMQTQTPSSTLILPYCPPLRSSVTRPNKYADNPTVSTILTTTVRCDLDHSFVSFMFSRPKESIRVMQGLVGWDGGWWGPRNCPAVGNFKFYGASEGFPPGDRLQRTQGFLKGKVDTASSAMLPFLLSFPPYKAPKNTNTRLHVHSVH